MSKPVTKTDPVTIRFDLDVAEALDRAREKEDRLLSWLVNRAAREWLQRNGYLKEPKSR